MMLSVLSGEVSRSSLAPSDSISHYMTSNQPAIRPSHYPPRILWTFEECKADATVGFSNGNSSRPNMFRALRHNNGDPITKGEWKAVIASANLVVHDLTKLSADCACTRSMTHFREKHYADWQLAIEKIEQLQPLLTTCAGHWKASHVIGYRLRQLNRKNNDNADSDSNCAEPDSVQGPTANNKRPMQQVTKITKRLRGENPTCSDTSLASNSLSFPMPNHPSDLSDPQAFPNIQKPSGDLSMIDVSFIHIDASSK
jgi:hypothetical protein